MSKFLKLAVAATLITGPAFAEVLDLGRLATSDEVAAWNTDVRPDGQGLPEGSGSVLDGEELFIENCASCHGDFGEGVGRWPVLTGGFDTLTDERPVKTTGSYWPYLSTVWDYIHRAMPFGYAESLRDDDVYAITAYLMYSNDLVDEDFVLSRENFLDHPLPNQDNFIPDDRATTEIPVFSKEVCMSDCKTDVEITLHAAIVDVTPEETAAAAAESAAVGASTDVESLEGGEVVAADSEAATTLVAETVSDANPVTTTQTAEVAMPVIELDPALVARGEKVFKKCKACHQLGEGARNKTGPVLTGVVGSAAGAVEDFKYSKPLMAMAQEGLIWDEASLQEFLTKPKAFIPRTKMSFSGLKKESDRDAIIAYLQSIAQ